jgi:MFS transporter, UMF1 family
VTVLAPAGWWRGLGGMTRSGSAPEALAWALYDFANTIFSFAIVSYAMGPWAVRFLGEGTGTLLFTVAASAAVALNALVSPILGAQSDRTGGRKGYLLVFTIACVVPTALIGFVDVGLGLLLFALANFSFQAALIYYDALLPDVARPEMRGRLSGVGVGLGYLGTIVSGLLLGFTVDADGRITAVSFVLVASLFAVFAIPIFLLVTERRGSAIRFTVADTLRSWSQLRTSVRHARQVPGLLRFIVARLFYTDPINTVIAVMSLFTINAIGFTEGEARLVLIGLTVVAVIASFGWGWLADRWGPKRTLVAVLVSWAAGLLVVAVTLSELPFLLAGAILGSGLGGVAVTDRLLLVRMAPRERIGEMFGLFGLVGKLSAVVGPLLYGGIVFVLLEPLGRGTYSVAILSLLALMLVGLWLLRGVPEPPLGAAEHDLEAAAVPREPGTVQPGARPR